MCSSFWGFVKIKRKYVSLPLLSSVVLCAAGGLLISGCGRTAPAEVDMVVDNADISAEDGTHVVQGNETLHEIAYQYSIDPQNLAKINGLRPPYKLRNGQVLLLPVEGEGRPAKSVPAPAVVTAKSSKDEQQLTTTKMPVTSQGGNYEAGSNRGYAVVRDGVEEDFASKSYRSSSDQNRKSSSSEELSFSTPKITASATNAAPVTTAAPLSKPSSNQSSSPKIAKKSLKMIMPVKGKVISRFGQKRDGIPNDGINIKAAKGTKVAAAADGEIIYVGNKLDEEYGNVVIIQHDNDVISSYAHLSKVSAKKGAKVKSGDTIGEVGNTGDVVEPQLYFEVMKKRTPVNPSIYF